MTTMFLDEKVQGERAWILWRRRWCCLRRIELKEGGLCEEVDDGSQWEEPYCTSMDLVRKMTMFLDEKNISERAWMKRTMTVFLNEKNVTVRAWTSWWIFMRRMLVKEELGILKKRIMLPDEKNVSERGAYQASWGRGRLSLNEKNIACWKSFCFVKKKKKMMMMFLDE